MTVDERIEVYTAAVASIGDRMEGVLHLCPLLKEIAKAFGHSPTGQISIDFPEFDAQRPQGKSNTCSWWTMEDYPKIADGIAIRLEALNNAIELAESVSKVVNDPF